MDPDVIYDLAAIRKLLESESGGSVCPSCNMPFDKGKKRKLIDTCGHERCYGGMFRNEACPLCTAGENGVPLKKGLGGVPNSLRGSEQTLYGETKASHYYQQQQQQQRPKVKTNGHFTPFMQMRQDQQDPCRLPRPSRSSADSCGPPPTVMTQSCPTPPQNRRKFFLSPKSIRSPFALRSNNSRVSSDTALSAFERMSASERMSSSTSSTCSTILPDNRRWSSVVLGKIKSLWSMGSIPSLAGLNQLSQSQDDEGGCIKPVMNPPSKKSSQNDLYMRLGLLLGDNARRHRPGSAGAGSTGCNRNTRDSCASISSLASLGEPHTHTLASNNTSPVSTLTGSSEADVHHRTQPSSESVGSLMSMSSQSNASSSPISRRHSVTTSQPGQIEELNIFKNRKTPLRRSARSGTVKGPIDPKAVRFAQYRQNAQSTNQLTASQQLMLKPLFFEVPLQEPDPVFIGRDWLVRELESTLKSPIPGTLITGLPGTGKTAFILQLVEQSCFGRRRKEASGSQEIITPTGKDRPSLPCTSPVSDRLKQLASQVVAYHFCQADNNTTCCVADFIHSVVAQLCQAPQLVAYREYLLSEAHVQDAVTLRECIADPDSAFTRGLLEPLSTLRRLGKIPTMQCFLLVDALGEAEYHRPDHGDTIASFLARHAHSFPSWLKIIATVRTHLEAVLPAMPFHKLSIDVYSPASDNISKDLLDYISWRVTSSPRIQSNVIPTSAGQHRFAQHLQGLARGSFLFAKLTLDLIERGSLVAKSASFKVLPVNLAQIYLLHFNLRFPTVTSFQTVSAILSVCLAALYPLTLLEIYYSVNALYTDTFLSWDEFSQRFKLLSGLLVKRMDNTYMFFHPSFREWLIRRDEGESNKFLCDLRTGHAGIAFRLSRLQAPLDADKSLELGHHILKAHVYKNMTLVKYSSRDLQAHWISSVCASPSHALCSLRNVYSPNVKVSRLLLLSGADPNHITEFLGAAPALCLFAYEGNSEMISLLLEFQASIDLPNSQGRTPLSLAASKGHMEAVRTLVAAGASLGRTDTAGRCALVHAARGGHLQVVAYLLGCDWVLLGPRGQEVDLAEAAQQALVAAAAQDHTEIVEYLLDMAEVRPDVQDSLTGETGLTMAALHGGHATCLALLNRGAGVSVANSKNLSPLILAVKEGHWVTAEKLLQHHAPLDQTDGSHKTPLMIAAQEGHVGLLELLLDKGADILREDAECLTALSWACMRGRVQAATHLLDRGAIINTADKTGRTPLDLAAFQGNPQLVQLLLDRGAMIEHVDINGLRPLDRAISCRNVPVVQCFLRKGAKLGPTTWSMAAGKPEVMLVLLNKLLEDGNVLFRKSRLKEAAHRYNYALNKFPPVEDLDATFHQLRLNFLLNHSRCKRKMDEPQEAVELATKVLKLKPDSYEAYYARAKAYLDLKMIPEAQSDLQEALSLLPPSNHEVRRVLLRLREEIRGVPHMNTSMDTLHQVHHPPETSL
uniref:Protein TANC2 n=1 Tax=Cacopsylla melanoneura TaxID=428564 RepID=A0A8D9ESN6_9HEMI